MMVLTLWGGTLFWDHWNLLHKRDPSSGWQSTDIMIAQSGCAAAKKTILVACDSNGNLAAYNQVIPTDDIGQGVLINLRASLQGRAVTMPEVAQNSFYLSMLALFILGGVVYGLAGLVGFLVLYPALGLIPVLNLFYYGAVTHGTHIATAIFAIAPALFLIKAGSKGWKAWKWASLFGLSLIGFLIAVLNRQAIAVMGLVALVAVAAIILRYNSSRINWLMTGAMVLAMGIILQSQLGVNLLGNSLNHLPAATTIVGHGFSHNLYIGLGEVPNSLGIVWDDHNGFAAVKSRDPEIKILSVQYYDMIREIFIQTLRDNPTEVLRIYGEKFFKILKAHSNLVLILVSFVVFGYGWWRSRSDLSDGLSKNLDCFSLGIVSLVMIVIFVIQAVLVNTDVGYFAPAYVFMLLVFAIGVSRIFRPLHQ